MEKSTAIDKVKTEREGINNMSRKRNEIKQEGGREEWERVRQGGRVLRQCELDSARLP